MKIVKRYTWEDALIEAGQDGILEAGAVNMCLRLAKAINWKPSGKRAGKPSGLYWKNETALKAVGSSKGTWKRYRKQLFQAGFLTEEKGNLIPQIPAAYEKKSQCGKSQCETQEGAKRDSTGRNVRLKRAQSEPPYSDDSFSEDTYSEKVGIDAPVVADAPPVTYEPREEQLEEIDSLASEEIASLAKFEDAGAFASPMTKSGQSQSETPQERRRRETMEAVERYRLRKAAIEQAEIDWFSIDLVQFERRYSGFLEASERLVAAREVLAMCQNRECGHAQVAKGDGTPDKRKKCPGEPRARTLVLMLESELRVMHNGDLFEDIGLGANVPVGAHEKK